MSSYNQAFVAEYGDFIYDVLLLQRDAGWIYEFTIRDGNEDTLFQGHYSTVLESKDLAKYAACAEAKNRINSENDS